MNTEKKETRCPTVTAHSGCMELPDNSIEAMEAGVAAGATIVEFDLRFTPEGRPILSHDAPTGDVVMLEDVLAFLRRHPGVRANVDVKDLAGLAAVPALAKRYGVLERLFYTGLVADRIPIAREKSPEIPYYLNTDVEEDPDAPSAADGQAIYEALAQKTKALGAVGVNLHHSHLTEGLVAACRKAGLLVSVWTVTDPAAIARVLPLRPDNITTRRPDLVLAAMKESD